MADAETELQIAFDVWRWNHGVVWSDIDIKLAEAICAVLGVELEWTDDG